MVSSIGMELRQTLREVGNGLRQPAQVQPGEVLFVRMVLLEHCQPLQFRLRFGQGEHGRIARGDRFHFGVGEFLAADVFGACGRRSRRS